MTTPSDASQAVELPPCSFPDGGARGFDIKDVQDYARAAIAQDRAARAQAEPVAWAHTLTFDGKPINATCTFSEESPFPDSTRPRFAHNATPLYRAARAGEAVRRLAQWHREQAHQARRAAATTACDAHIEGRHDFMAEGCKKSASWHDEQAALLTASTIPQAAEVPGFVPLTDERIRGAFMQTNTRSYDATYACFRDGVRFAEKVFAAAPTPTASAPKAEGDAEPETFVSRWTRVIRDMPSTYEHPATQPSSEADQTRASGDVVPYCPGCSTGSQCKAAGVCLDGASHG